MNMTIRAKVVKIGNSRGVRIPRALLEQAGLTDEVEMTVDGSKLIIHSARLPRQGWDAQFASMAEHNDDLLLDQMAFNSMGRGRMDVVVKRFEVYLVNLDPTLGSEIQKTRPCLIISPDEMNDHINTVIVAPMTIRGRNYPTRINCHFEEKEGQIILDQIWTVDKIRLVKKLGIITTKTQKEVLAGLMEMFAE